MRVCARSELMKAMPTHTGVIHWRGVCLYADGNHAGALKHFQAGWHACSSRGLRAQHARLCAQQVLRLDPDNQKSAQMHKLIRKLDDGKQQGNQLFKVRSRPPARPPACAGPTHDHGLSHARAGGTDQGRNRQLHADHRPGSHQRRVQRAACRQSVRQCERACRTIG
jgi:hypothetical protein